MKTVVVVLLLLSTATAMVMADDQYLAWDIEMLASEDEYSLLLVSDEIELRNPRDRVLKRISRKRVESLDRIMRDIERAAELDTQFLIVQGCSGRPNRWANPDDDPHRREPGTKKGL